MDLHGNLNASEYYNIYKIHIRNSAVNVMNNLSEDFNSWSRWMTDYNLRKDAITWGKFRRSMLKSVGLLADDGEEEKSKQLLEILNERTNLIKTQISRLSKVSDLDVKDANPAVKKEIKEDVKWFASINKLFEKAKKFVEKNYLYALLIMLMIIILFILMLMDAKRITDIVVKSINDSIKKISDNIAGGNIGGLIVDVLSAPFKIIHQIMSKGETKLLVVGSMCMILICGIVYKLVTNV